MTAVTTIALCIRAVKLKIYFGLKNTSEILNELKSKAFLASLCLHMISLLYILKFKEILTELTEHTLNNSLNLVCNEKHTFYF